MTFYEQELRKIVGARYSDATYVGRAAYVRLSDMNRAKIWFTTCGISSHYEALQMAILNRCDGQVDSLRLRFADILGVKQVTNPNFREGISPHIWDDHGKPHWYVYHPSSRDYHQLSDAVGEYLSVFQEQKMTPAQGWEQTM